MSRKARVGVLTGLNDEKENGGREKSSKEAGFDGTENFDNYAFDPFFGINLKNPKISRAVFDGYCAGVSKIRLSSLKSTNKELKDWITVGVIVDKSDVRKSANGKEYVIWKIHDLKDVQQNPVKVLMFGDCAKNHWKLPPGFVIALVCPQFADEQQTSQEGKMPQTFKRNAPASNLVTLKLIKSNQVIELGVSANYAICKSFRQDGLRCSNFVNTSLSEVCIFHVTNEARRLAARRGTFSSISSMPKPHQEAQQNAGSSPNLFVRNSSANSMSLIAGQALNSSGTIRVSSANVQEARPKELKPTTLEEERKTLEEIVQSRPQSLSSRILKKATDAKMQSKSSPSAGRPTLSPSKLIKSMPSSSQTETKPASFAEFLKEAEKANSQVKNVLLKKEEDSIKSEPLSQSSVQPVPVPVVPRLGMNCHSSRGGRSAIVTLERSPQKRLASLQSAEDGETAPSSTRSPLVLDERAEAAKRRAVAVLKRKAAEASQTGIRLGSIDNPEESAAKKRKLESVDDTKLEELLKRRPKSYAAVQEAQNEELQTRLNKMEEREKLETFMNSTTSVKNVKVVTCKECGYTAQSASEFCKNKGHSLTWSKAEKRFFKCKSCRSRCVAFGLLPHKRCKTCGDKGEWERVAMCDERKVKLETEKLELRGEERKFVNS
ncbi:hypothetical protein WR25_19119 [Diploscapter pachys]|uniref:Protein MCM10 homolog n=1 Tax=Diploscapter pachys TaxID=2018661 RepID=A0A2A2L3D6_9BILA|nr:hypothetical protein WR25_19119 [Diploscapter pachys]